MHLQEFEGCPFVGPVTRQKGKDGWREEVGPSASDYAHHHAKAASLPREGTQKMEA